MPLFDFRCDDCGHKFEELTGADDYQVMCPNCSSRKTSRLLSLFAASVPSPAAANACGQSSCPSGGFT
ncbi:MAG: zinc ribbon domain-containing protein [Candidatus Zixiibacteriota bacterium]|nr:MAG: zinc ribbon domain-containing protein [candidate division Zixibacteria bacterium]